MSVLMISERLFAAKVTSLRIDLEKQFFKNISLRIGKEAVVLAEF
jgi:hypothetical protein